MANKIAYYRKTNFRRLCISTKDAIRLKRFKLKTNCKLAIKTFQLHIVNKTADIKDVNYFAQSLYHAVFRSIFLLLAKPLFADIINEQIIFIWTYGHKMIWKTSSSRILKHKIRFLFNSIFQFEMRTIQKHFINTKMKGKLTLGK